MTIGYATKVVHGYGHVFFGHRRDTHSVQIWFGQEHVALHILAGKICTPCIWTVNLKDTIDLFSSSCLIYCRYYWFYNMCRMIFLISYIILHPFFTNLKFISSLVTPNFRFRFRTNIFFNYSSYAKINHSLSFSRDCHRNFLYINFWNTFDLT